MRTFGKKKWLFVCALLSLAMSSSAYAAYSIYPKIAESKSPLASSSATSVEQSAITAVMPNTKAPPLITNGVNTTTGWQLTPAGEQLTLGSFSMGGALSPDGRYLVVSNDGVAEQTLQVIDIAANKVVQSLSYNAPEALYLGLVFSPEGSKLYASAGGNNKIRIYQFKDGLLSEQDSIPVRDSRGTSFYPAGIAISTDGNRLYTANNLDHSVSRINLETKKIEFTVPVGKSPYTPWLSRDGKTVYVSNWGESSVTALDAESMKLKRLIPVGLHPNAIAENPINGLIYVSNSDSDDITIIDPSLLQVVGNIPLSPAPDAPTGSQPDALAVSSDGKKLYIANAGNNDVAVIQLDQAGIASGNSITGLIPTAWYPTGVFLSKDESKLLVLNAKGMGSGPNNKPVQWVGSMMTGTLSIINIPSNERLQEYTKQVQYNNRPSEGSLAKSAASDGQQFPIPRFIGQDSPIKHVIYVIKENRTYDDILGDLERGNGDPSLVEFAKTITPNHHKLANQFVILDRLYAVSDVSADGQNWSTAGKANDYVQKNWLANYSGRNRDYDFEGGGGGSEPSGAPFTRSKEGYFWDMALKSGLTFRNYGLFMQNYDAKTKQFFPNDKYTTDFGGNYDPYYGGWDLSLSDMTRYAEWEKEFKVYEKNGNLPQLETVYLPDDHTAGTFPGYRTPQAMMASNDLALGKLVETVSHSRFWNSTAIFVIEDDAQSGVDHVEAHRIVALAISPYTQTGAVDSTPYNTTSMLRTMELILGLKPMTQFDASSIPMLAAFTATPNFTPYQAVSPEYPLDRLNGEDAPNAQISKTLDFSSPDAADRDKLNDAIWQTTNGAKPDPKKHN
ncbi:beta-propeller fold lactonase family protein [Paenibacillus sp. GCM10027628]|uniref:beta-propeller fold lactonase family protein n=1 Tax=Paenibacillus sp. GCM10027628 TaxID=3273413 RepID=UPI0036416CF5